MNKTKIPFENMPLKKRENIEFFMFAIMAIIVTSYTIHSWYSEYKTKKALSDATREL